MAPGKQKRDDMPTAIPDHPDYTIGIDGTVRRRTPGPATRPGRELTPWPDRQGYLRVEMDRRAVYVRRLVADAFLGPQPPGMDLCHRNLDKSDCRAANLIYDTRSSHRRRWWRARKASM